MSEAVKMKKVFIYDYSFCKACTKSQVVILKLDNQPSEIILYCEQLDWDNTKPDETKK